MLLSWKIQKSWYLGNGTTDRHEIWHDDAIWHSRRVPELEICNFKNQKNPRWRRPPFWKFKKSPYFGRGFSNFDKNLAPWRSSTVLTVRSVTNLKFKNPRWRRPPFWKVQKSRRIENRKSHKKGNVNHTNIDIQAMLVWLTLPFYDFCGFLQISNNSKYFTMSSSLC